MISLKNKVVLAPMAGVTDRAYREICMSYGADMCFTEMVSTKGLFYNDKKTATLLGVSERNNLYLHRYSATSLKFLPKLRQKLHLLVL